MSETPAEKQKRITPDKSGKGKHKVEDDKTSDTTKPPTDPHSHPKKPHQN